MLIRLNLRNIQAVSLPPAGADWWIFHIGLAAISVRVLIAVVGMIGASYWQFREDRVRASWVRIMATSGKLNQLRNWR
jgi:hypothetical protein